AVDGDDAVVTLHLDPLAEPAGGPGLDDRAVDGRDDRGADAVREVDAVVGGAPPGAETGGEGAFGRLDDLGPRGLDGRLAASLCLRGESRVGQFGAAVDLLGLGRGRGVLDRKSVV